jgi:hypothetical protein
MVAMNPQSYRTTSPVGPGWLLYDSTLPRIWPRRHHRAGRTIAGSAPEWSDTRQRQLFKTWSMSAR